MPRKGHVTKRDVLADPVYNSKLVTKLINHLMIDGKRAKASSILYDAFNIVQDKTGGTDRCNHINPAHYLFVRKG